MIKILAAGPYSTVQDRGRPGYQWLGIPEGGVLDRDALMLGNALVGNAPEAAALEICIGGFAMELMRDTRLALTGSKKAVLSVQAEGGHNIKVPAMRSINLRAGHVVRLDALPDSNAALICLEGGVDLPLFYDSRSTSPSAQLGGLEGRVLRNGDILPLGEPSPQMRDAPEWMADEVIAGELRVIRAVRGPQDERFTAKAIASFFSENFTVSPTLNRMGMRLEGATLAHKDGADIPSDGIVTGTVQVPGSGEPIVLLADHQSTGGYTKIATVISADMPKLARLSPHDSLRFEEVSNPEAEAIARTHRQSLLAAIANKKVAPPILDSAMLYALGSKP